MTLLRRFSVKLQTEWLLNYSNGTPSPCIPAKGDVLLFGRGTGDCFEQSHRL